MVKHTTIAIGATKLRFLIIMTKDFGVHSVHFMISGVAAHLSLRIRLSVYRRAFDMYI